MIKEIVIVVFGLGAVTVMIWLAFSDTESSDLKKVNLTTKNHLMIAGLNTSKEYQNNNIHIPSKEA